MTDNVENLMLEMLRRIDQRIDNVEGDMRDTKVRMTMVEEHLGNFMIGVSGVNSRLDRMVERVERIERRLDLTEQH